VEPAKGERERDPVWGGNASLASDRKCGLLPRKRTYEDD